MSIHNLRDSTTQCPVNETDPVLHLDEGQPGGDVYVARHSGHVVHTVELHVAWLPDMYSLGMKTGVLLSGG